MFVKGKAKKFLIATKSDSSKELLVSAVAETRSAEDLLVSVAVESRSAEDLSV